MVPEPTVNMGSLAGPSARGLVNVRPVHGRAYVVPVLLFLASLALSLLAVVDVRRGFLFPLEEYLRLGAPTAILYLDLRQVPLLLVGSLGAWLAYRRMAALDMAASGTFLKRVTTLLAVAILVLLVMDIFIYRGVPAFRIAATGKMGIGQAISFDGWAKPIGDGLNYLALVWHATALAMLLGALFLTAMAGRLNTWLTGRGLDAHLRGAALAIPQPFCSCCSAPIGATLYRRGASLGSTLAFVVSSPMLNVTGLLLAALLLPWQFAVLRLGGGIVLGIFATYLVSVVAARWSLAYQMAPAGPESWPARLLESYARLFDLERIVSVQPPGSPSALVATWLTTALRLGLLIIPVVLVGSIITAAVVAAVPLPQNNLGGVAIAAVLGTLLMIPTWTEIPIASQLINEGLTGPAAALLLTLPAVSVPCLAVITGAVRSLRVSLLLGVAVFAAGIVAGGIFLMISVG